MGNASTSGKSKNRELTEREKIESLFQTELVDLKRSFAHLAAQSGEGVILKSSFEEHFRIVPKELDEGSLAREEYLPLSKVAKSIGSLIVKHGFSAGEKLDWMTFLKGAAKCCKEASSIKRLELLVSLFASFPPEETPENPPLQKISEIEEAEPEITQEAEPSLLESAHFDPETIQTFLLCCWFMMCQVHSAKNGDSFTEFRLIETDFLVDGARRYCLQKAKGKSVPVSLNNAENEPETQLFSAVDIVSWASLCIPAITDCLSDFVYQKLITEAPMDQAGVIQKEKAAEVYGATSTSDHPESSSAPSGVGQLSSSHLWAIGLSQRGPLSSVLLSLCCDPEAWEKSPPNLLYRSSLNGRGISRFFAHVEGYAGAVLLLLRARLTLVNPGQRWSMAFISSTGFENRTSFYGGSGCNLVAIDPVFLPIRAMGKESNFVYSHAKTPGQVYSSVQRVQGIGFGGSPGKERVWIDEEFRSVTVRHHGLDKTYQSGFFVPGQGYGGVESAVEEIEVWGMAGKEAEMGRMVFQRREHLFKEQRGKVDLKSFGTSWEASPENMMLNMMSDPNKGAREER